MTDHVQRFIKALEKKETWGFGRLDEKLAIKANEYAEKFIDDVHAASQVSIETWALFAALLPYQKSLNVLSDLSLVLPNTIKKIVTLDKVTQRDDVLNARLIILERLNILVRQELHLSLLTVDRSRAIKQALAQINGYYK